MSKLEDKFNVDLTDLQNLLEGVVAYVEVRVGNDDISNEIAREMKEIGAIISENKNNKVTHVIFRNGTLRTSNWAKRHDIPLIDIGWLAACTKNKINLLPRPWRVCYLEDSVDIFGTKKRKRYKKYFKNMNIEEYEAAMEKAKEKRNKQLEKSLNNSKSDMSLEKFDSPENERRWKRCDPLRKPPTPEIIKRYEARIEKYKITGRYSWESDNESSAGEQEKEENLEEKSKVDENQLENQNNKSSENNEIESNSNELIENKDSKQINTLPNESVSLDCNTTDNKENSFVEKISTPKERKFIKSRRLFSQLNFSQESLIEPVPHSVKDNELKSVLPEAVHKVISGNNKPLKRKSLSRSGNAQMKRQSSMLSTDVSDICLPKKIVKLQNNTNNENNNIKSDLFISPTALTKTDSVSNKPVSPLITNKSTPKNIFTTPKTSKRKSLRVRLLKKSAKKKYQQIGYIDDDFQSSTDDDQDKSVILVPETTNINHSRSPIDINVIGLTALETPEFSGITNKSNNTDLDQSLDIFKNPKNSVPTPELSKNSHADESLSVSVLGIFDTPNASRFLDKIIPNRKKLDSYDHILFIPKDSYYHCTKSISPEFENQKQYVASLFEKPSKQYINDIFISETQKSVVVPRIPTRRSLRLSVGRSVELPTGKDSNSNESVISSMNDPISIGFNETQSSSNKSTRKSLRNIRISNDDQSTNSPNSIEINDAQSSSKNSTRKSIKNSKETPSTSTGEQEETGKSISQSVHKQSPQENDPMEIFKFSEEEPSQKRNVRKLVSAKPLSELVTKSSQRKPISESANIKNTNRKRPWSQVEKDNTNNKSNKKKTVKCKKPRDSDFVFSPLVNRKHNKSPLSTLENELILVGFSVSIQNEIKALLNKLPPIYRLGEFIRSKEQIIIVPENPKKSVELIKAFVFGNTFVSVKWIRESSELKKWMNYSSFIIKDNKMIDIPLSNVEKSSLFNEYTSMYLSSATNGIQKYKLRIIIEMAGGQVTDSFRQAGIVINTKKVNALSINENWILDSIKEGKVLNTKPYLLS